MDTIGKLGIDNIRSRFTWHTGENSFTINDYNFFLERLLSVFEKAGVILTGEGLVQFYTAYSVVENSLIKNNIVEQYKSVRMYNNNRCDEGYRLYVVLQTKYREYLVIEYNLETKNPFASTLTDLDKTKALESYTLARNEYTDIFGH